MGRDIEYLFDPRKHVLNVVTEYMDFCDGANWSRFVHYIIYLNTTIAV